MRMLGSPAIAVFNCSASELGLAFPLGKAARKSREIAVG